MSSYNSYKESGVEWLGKIPIHWKLTRIKFTSDISKSSISTEEMEDQILYHYSIPNIQEIGTGKLEEGNDIDSSKLLLKGGEVLISKLNPRKATICVVQEHDALIVGSGEFVSFYPISIDQYYLYYYFLNQRFTEYLDSSVESVTRSHQRVKPDIIYNSPIYLPPLIEQQKIVNFLDEKNHKIDDLIQQKERKIELLKEKRTALISQVVTKGLDPNVEMKDSGVEWIGEIPKHWMCGKLNYHTSRIGDGLHSTPEYIDESDFRFINGNNLINGSIKYFDSTKCVSETEYKKHYIELDENTLLLSINGTIGNLSYYNNEKVILGKSACYIRCLGTLNKNFLFYVLSSDSINKYFTFELTGTTIYNLSLNSVRKTPLPLPSLEEQLGIVNYLNLQTKEIDDLIELEQMKINLLKEYRLSLISEVVTGKIRVCEEDHSLIAQTA